MDQVACYSCSHAKQYEWPFYFGSVWQLPAAYLHFLKGMNLADIIFWLFFRCCQSSSIYILMPCVMNTDDLQYILYLNHCTTVNLAWAPVTHFFHSDRFSFHSAVSLCCLQSKLLSGSSLSLTDVSTSAENLSKVMLQNPGWDLRRHGARAL